MTETRTAGSLAYLGRFLISSYQAAPLATGRSLFSVACHSDLKQFWYLPVQYYGCHVFDLESVFGYTVSSWKPAILSLALFQISPTSIFSGKKCGFRQSWHFETVRTNKIVTSQNRDVDSIEVRTSWSIPVLSLTSIGNSSCCFSSSWCVALQLSPYGGVVEVSSDSASANFNSSNPLGLQPANLTFLIIETDQGKLFCLLLMALSGGGMCWSVESS